MKNFSYLCSCAVEHKVSQVEGTSIWEDYKGNPLPLYRAHWNHVRRTSSLGLIIWTFYSGILNESEFDIILRAYETARNRAVPDAMCTYSWKECAEEVDAVIAEEVNHG